MDNPTAKDRIVVPGLNENSLKVYRGGAPKPSIPSFVAVRRDGPWVLLAINDKVCQLTTTQAHDTACAIMFLVAECTPLEYVVLGVNGESYDFPQDNAEALSRGLLRKADHVDDFHIYNRMRILK